MAGRVNGTGLARETQAPPGKPVSSLPFQGKGFEPSGTQHSCFGNCAELSLNVSKGSWIPAVLGCQFPACADNSSMQRADTYRLTKSLRIQ